MSESNDDSNNTDAINAFENHVLSFGHLYALVVLFITTILTRIQGYGELRREDGWVFLGNDAWYHARATIYSVQNYPYQLSFDPKTGYPEGASPGAFGTLYNFLHATVSMILGLGDPSQSTVEAVLVFSSPVLSAVCVIVAYYAAKYITDSKFAGVSAATILTFIPGTFYSRGLAGFAQHHILEPIMLVLSLVMVMKALEFAEKNYVLKGVVRDFDSDAKTWSKKTSLAILAIFIYYLSWPPAIMIFGLTGITAVIYSISGFSGSRSRPALMTLTVITATMPIMTILVGPADSFSAANPSYLHVGVALLSFAMTAFVWLLSVVSENRNWSFSRFTGIIVGLALVSTTLTFILTPQVISAVFDQIIRLLGYPLGIGQGGDVSTIAEERVPSVIELATQQYGLMLPTANIGLICIIYTIFERKDEDKGYGKEIYLIVICGFIGVISMRTARYNYYFAPVIAILATVAIYKMIELVDFPNKLLNFKGYHILTVILLLLLFIPVLFVPLSGAAVYQDPQIDRQMASYEQWEQPLDWLEENSRDDNIETYGPYPNKDEHTYPEDSYSVISWWDYGHWITYTSDRTPISNPFQQNAGASAEFLLSQNEGDAQEVIDRIGEESGTDAELKYVLIDWQMASTISKYPAMEQFKSGFSQGDSSTSYYSSRPGEGARLQFDQKEQLYYETMIGRLFVGHGSAMEASNTTINYDTQRGIRIIQPSTNPIVEHNTTKEARQVVENNTEISRGGLTQPPERVASLDHYRLVKSSSGRTFRTRTFAYQLRNINGATDRELGVSYLNDNPSTVKIFEKVEGAKLSGTGFEGHETLELEVDMIDPAFTRSPGEFTYKKRVEVEDGTFNSTVPYSTTGYNDSENAPEVRSNSEYRLVTPDGETVKTFEVEESSVVNGDAITIEADE